MRMNLKRKLEPDVEDKMEEKGCYSSSFEDCVPTDRDEVYDGWKHLIPFRPAPKNPKTLPLIHAGLFSYLSLHWLNSLVYQAYKHGLRKEDLYATPREDSAEHNSLVFEQFWKEEVDRNRKEQASVSTTILRMVKSRFILSAVLCIVFNTLAILRSVYFLQKILTLIQTPGDTLVMQIVYMLLLGLCSLARSFLFATCLVIMTNAGIRVRAGVLSVVFRKVLSSYNQETTVGELVNLCSNDGQRLYEAVFYSTFMFSCIPAVGAAIYSVYLLGFWGLFGFIIFFAFIPVQMLLSKVVYYFRGRVIPITEERVKLMSEIVTAIKLVKMYAWEKSFARKIQDVRAKERLMIQYSLMAQGILSALPILVPIFCSALTFLAMTLSGYDVTITQAFVYLSLLNAMRFSLASMPFSLKALAEGYHTCGRVKDLLIKEEEEMELSPLRSSDNLVEIRNGYFGWACQEKTISSDDLVNTELPKSKQYGSFNKLNSTSPITINLNGRESQPLLAGEMEESSTNTVVTLHDITFTLKKLTLLGVCGPVGSGKTSLMQAILRMMKKKQGCIALDTSMKIAYVPQQAWIMNETVRENIIFGKAYQEKRYNQVVEACALLSDFNQLPAGDQTEIGERGINLSGGQKQRISIARAIYSDSDLILLDDPLSAVDALVGQHIFTNCLKGLLSSKTVLFITHQLQFLTECDSILVMKDGRIAEEGTHETLMKDDDGEYSSLIRSFHDSGGGDKEQKEIVQGTEDNSETGYSVAQDSPGEKAGGKEAGAESLLEISEKQITGKLTTEENMEEDSVNLSTLAGYLKAGGGFTIVLLVLLCILIFLVVQGFANYWVSLWTQAGSGGVYVNRTVTINGTNTTVLFLSESLLDNPELSFYQSVYGTSLIFLVAFALLNVSTFMAFCLKASTTIHNRLFTKLVSSPMRFFDVTPSGQILNRFSKDLDEVDSMLPFQSDTFFKNGGFIIMSIATIIIVFPLFILAMVPIVLISYILYKFCRKVIQLTKRVENVTKSPLFSHIGTTIQGLATIKAYEKENRFYGRFNKLQDETNMAMFLFDTSMRWTAVRYDIICIFVVFLTFIFITVIPREILSASMAALALTSAITIGDLIQVALRYFVLVEARLTSAKRILNYIDNLESEAPAVVEHRRPDASWPEEGAIKFDNVDVRYREGLPLVLKSISLDIKPQEKIGIVGRTGSGKSSMALTLFRIMELAGGSITIDNVDISTVGLEDLRSKLSIIPQDPVLFVGTVRYNLDPFGVYRDEELWSALKKCHVKHTIKALDGQLDALIVENGENFSVGERQLLCMARALLRHSKVLVLDEATAAIDTETDSLIQDTIKEAFADCTMLTIAHRLNTVSNYDRILVLDDGKVIEFDTPSALLSNQNSVFFRMMSVQESQKKAAMMN